MSRFVTGTHALYRHLTQDQKLSPVAQQIFQDADAGKKSNLRIITATALQLDLPLITKDEDIQKSAIVTIIW